MARHLDWCPWWESDPRPLPYQGSALPLSHKGENLKASRPRMERETGIEPASLAWKARVLPLNYSREPLRTAATDSFCWWRGLDSNQRTLKRADLQSAAINHSATSPAENHGLCHQLTGADKWCRGVGQRFAHPVDGRIAVPTQAVVGAAKVPAADEGHRRAQRRQRRRVVGQKPQMPLCRVGLRAHRLRVASPQHER